MMESTFYRKFSADPLAGRIDLLTFANYTVPEREREREREREGGERPCEENLRRKKNILFLFLTCIAW